MASKASRFQQLFVIILAISFSLFCSLAGFAQAADAGQTRDAAWALRAIGSEQNDLDVQQIIRVADASDDAQRMSIYRALGMRAYLLGDVSSAIEYLSKVVSRDGKTIDADALLLAAHALLLTGETARSQELVRQVLRVESDPAVRQQAVAVLGLARLWAGEDLAAEALFDPFRAQPEQVRIPELLYLLIRYELVVESALRKDPGVYYALLQRRFPGHPVTLLARDFLESGSNATGNVSLIPSPELFLFASSNSEPVETQAENMGSRETTTQHSNDTLQVNNDDAPDLIGIQVGSFGLRENADHLLKDLEEQDFPVVVEEQQREDRLYYMVIIPFSAEYTPVLEKSFGTSDPEDIYMRLKSAGFDGFRIYR